MTKTGFDTVKTGRSETQQCGKARTAGAVNEWSPVVYIVAGLVACEDPRSNKNGCATVLSRIILPSLSGPQFSITECVLVTVSIFSTGFNYTRG